MWRDSKIVLKNLLACAFYFNFKRKTQTILFWNLFIYYVLSKSKSVLSHCLSTFKSFISLNRLLMELTVTVLCFIWISVNENCTKFKIYQWVDTNFAHHYSLQVSYNWWLANYDAAEKYWCSYGFLFSLLWVGMVVQSFKHP